MMSTWLALPSQGFADSALVAPVQVDESLDASLAHSTKRALATALRVRGFTAITKEKAGRNFRDCATPGCNEQVLRAAGDCSFGIAATVWKGNVGQAPQLALTLIDATSRDVNAIGLISGDLISTVERLVDELLVAWRAEPNAIELETPEPTAQPGKKNAWLAGPISMIGVGVGAVGAIGIASAIKGNNEKLNTAGAAAWGALGAAAIGGGIAWWVIGKKNRNEPKALTIQVSPTHLIVKGKF